MLTRKFKTKNNINKIKLKLKHHKKTKSYSKRLNQQQMNSFKENYNENKITTTYRP